VYPASFPGNQPVFQQQFAAYQQPPQQQLAPSQQEQLRAFWQGQLQEVQQVGNDPAEFKNHQLPLARIKKVGSRRAGWAPAWAPRTLAAPHARGGRQAPRPSPPQIMKSDEDVRMISAEAPVLFARVGGGGGGGGARLARTATKTACFLEQQQQQQQQQPRPRPLSTPHPLVPRRRRARCSSWS
jgi:hypothetical protein